MAGYYRNTVLINRCVPQPCPKLQTAKVRRLVNFNSCHFGQGWVESSMNSLYLSYTKTLKMRYHLMGICTSDFLVTGTSYPTFGQMVKFSDAPKSNSFSHKNITCLEAHLFCQQLNGRCRTLWVSLLSP